MQPSVRIAAAVAAVCAVPLLLVGCALQADWDGSKKLESEECRLAAQLFTSTSVPSELVALGEKNGEHAGDVSSPLTRTELAAALIAYVPEDMHDALHLYALPQLDVSGDESEEQLAEAMDLLNARSSAEAALRGWAQLACGVEVAGEPEEQPTLAQLQTFETELDGVRTVSIAGAVDPDHAVALCEELRLNDAEAQVQVTDGEGFPLARALPGAACGYDPILLEGLEPE